MSDSVIFDTHACVKRMTKAGVEPHVAEAFAAEQVNILEHHIATKTDIGNIQRDIEGLRKDTTTAIEGLRKDTKIELAQLEAKLTDKLAATQFKIIVWNTGALATFTGLALATAKLLL